MKFLGCYSILTLVPFLLNHAIATPEAISTQLNVALKKNGKAYLQARGFVKLALVKLPAKKTSKYKGAVYLQIGVGASSTNLVLEFGPSFQTGRLEGYDFVGWDVRGVGQSTPLLKCFSDEAARQAFVAATPKILGDPSVSLEESIKLNLAHSKVLGEGGKKESGSFLPYFDTLNNARDLHTIMCAIGHEKLDTFWGYEYRTLIGETFASLYPNSYKHIVLDGVIQGEKQYGPGDFGPSSVQDADKAFGVFFDSCAKAGATNCLFWEKTADLVEARFNKVVAKLIKKPVPVPGLGEFGYSQLYSLIGPATTAPGEPFYLYPYLAAILAEAEKRAPGGAIYSLLGGPLEPLVNNNTIGSFEYSTAIQCLDSDPYHINSPKDFIPYLKRMLRASKATGATVAGNKLGCAGWKIPAAVNFNGYGAFNINSKGKVLLIGNTADPRTPLQNAKSMSRKLRNSRVLTINAVGWSSLPYNSACRAQAINAFLNDDKFPARDAVCQEDNPPVFVPLGDL